MLSPFVKVIVLAAIDAVIIPWSGKEDVIEYEELTDWVGTFKAYEAVNANEELTACCM